MCVILAPMSYSLNIIIMKLCAIGHHDVETTINNRYLSHRLCFQEPVVSLSSLNFPPPARPWVTECHSQNQWPVPGPPDQWGGSSDVCWPIRGQMWELSRQSEARVWQLHHAVNEEAVQARGVLSQCHNVPLYTCHIEGKCHSHSVLTTSTHLEITRSVLWWN